MRANQYDQRMRGAFRYPHWLTTSRHKMRGSLKSERGHRTDGACGLLKTHAYRASPEAIRRPLRGRREDELGHRLRRPGGDGTAIDSRFHPN